MTAQEFEVKSAYDEWFKLNPIIGTKSINRDRAYQNLLGTAYPSDRLPAESPSRSIEVVGYAWR